MFKKPKIKLPYRWGQVPIAWEVVDAEGHFKGFIEGGTDEKELKRRVKALYTSYMLSGKYIFKCSQNRKKPE